MNWTCAYCGGHRDSAREQCPGCGAARTKVARPRLTVRSDRDKNVMDYILCISSLGPEWAKLWQVGNCEECGGQLYANESEVNGMTLPVKGQSHPWCREKKRDARSPRRTTRKISI